MSHELKRRGFHFLGPADGHSFIQITEMEIDPARGCFRRRVLGV